MKVSCDKPCSQSDYYKGDYCDKMGCYESDLAREKLEEFAKLCGWDKNKLIGWSEASDFAEWYATQELQSLRDRVKELEDALINIREYWNRDSNVQAMEDACWHVIDKATEVLG